MPSDLSDVSVLLSSLPGVLAGWGVSANCPSPVEFCMAGPDWAEGATGGGVAFATPSAFVSLPLSSAGSSGVVIGAGFDSVGGMVSVCVLWEGFDWGEAVATVEVLELDRSLKFLPNLRSSSSMSCLCWTFTGLLSWGLAGLSIRSLDRISFTSTVNERVGPVGLGVTVVAEVSR